jgi:hypothetical protein
MPGLPIPERMDNQKRLPITLNFGTYGQTLRIQIFHKTRCAMGLQQHQDQRWRSMESRV